MSCSEATAATAGVLLCIIFQLPAQASGSDAEREQWAGRILSSFQRIERPSNDEDAAHLVALAANGLAIAGKVEQALELVDEHVENERLRHFALQQIVEGQSTVDDLKGALATAELLPEGFQRDYALMLIVARQAQRGDFRDAVALLAQIPSPEKRDKALELTISAQIDAGALEQADELLERINDETIQTNCQERVLHAREKPSPTDEDYTERMVGRARERKRFGEREERLLRLVCQARFAAARDDLAARDKAMQSASHCISDWGPNSRIGPLLDLALLHYEFGESVSARDLFRQSFAIVEEAGPFVFLKFALREDCADAIVRVIDADEVEQWVNRLAVKPSGYTLMGSLVAAFVASGGKERADAIYERLDDPKCSIIMERKEVS